jgi:hypothetical protein
MALVAIPPPRLGDYRVDVTQVPKDGGRGTKALRFVVRDPETGEVVPAFTEVHERVFHLFIISRDLSYFAHEHPVRAGDAFELAVDLPPGAYVVVADFLPSAGTPQMVQQAIVTPGYTASPFVSNATLEVDAAERVVDGLRIRVDSADVRSGRAGLLRFVVSDAASGAPVTDLEPYLGAPGHLLIANPDLTETIHAHPEGRTAGGPDVLFGPVIPSPGLYKLWVQVQRRGRVITAPFVVRVP